jgi:hypothetical protein
LGRIVDAARLWRPRDASIVAGFRDAGEGDADAVAIRQLGNPALPPRVAACARAEYQKNDSALCDVDDSASPISVI